MAKLAELGGAAGLADILHSSTHQGLESTANGAGSVEEHRRVFGPNTFPPAPQKNFFVLCFENIQDPIILLLMAAALVSLDIPLAHWPGYSTGGCAPLADAGGWPLQIISSVSLLYARDSPCPPAGVNSAWGSSPRATQRG